MDRPAARLGRVPLLSLSMSSPTALRLRRSCGMRLEKKLREILALKRRQVRRTVGEARGRSDGEVGVTCRLAPCFLTFDGGALSESLEVGVNVGCSCSMFHGHSPQ